MKKNVLFLAALVFACGFNPVFAQPEDQTKGITITTVASQKSFDCKLSLEQLVQKGIEKVNAGKLQEAEDLFAQASNLVEIK